MMYGETVTRLRATVVTDPYSGEATELSWVNPDSLDIPGVAIEPRPQPELVTDARNAVVSAFTLYAPFGSDVKAADRLRVRGDVFEVDGDVADWRSPFSGWEAGTVIQTKRVDG